MEQTLEFTIDGLPVTAAPGETIMAAADAAGIYIPRLCAMKGLSPFGACRLCTVLVDGRSQSACTQPAAAGMVVENDTEQLQGFRKNLIDMLFVEGNHFCMACEKSGNCELQALAYRFGILAPKYQYQFPQREIDASHPDVLLDRNRCILCARCVRASQELDGKEIAGFVGRGGEKRLAASSGCGFVGTDVAADDAALAACPVGALLRKRVGFSTPIGQRKYDHQPIGCEKELRPEKSSTTSDVQKGVAS